MLKKVVIFAFISTIKAQLISISDTQVCLESVYRDELQGCKKVFYLKVQPLDCSNGCFCTFVWQLTFNEWLSKLPLVVITIWGLLTAIHCWMCLYWSVLQTTLHTFSSICTLLFKEPVSFADIDIAPKIFSWQMPLRSEWFLIKLKIHCLFSYKNFALLSSGNPKETTQDCLSSKGFIEM